MAALTTALAAGLTAAGSSAAQGSPPVVDGVLEADVPVPVMLIGFPRDSVRDLRERLEPLRVHQAAFDANQVLPVEPADGVGSHLLTADFYDLPIATTARFELRAADLDLEADFARAIRESVMEDAPPPITGGRNLQEEEPPTLLSGRRVEDWLARELPRRGFQLDRDTPALVLLHLDALGMGDHDWAYVLENGRSWSFHHRVFGERKPLLILDPSTRTPTDCNRHSNYFITPREVCAPQVRPYESRLAASGEDLAKVAEFVRDAVRYRILQGSIFPVSTAKCHAITFVFGYHPTSTSDFTDAPDALERFDPVALERAVERITGRRDLYVDTRVIRLPVDDPVLDAFLRADHPVGYEVGRWWLRENWARYWVPHAGCEAYVSLVVHGDAAQVPGPGAAYYDQGKGYRVSFGVTAEYNDFTADPNRPTNYVRDPERRRLDIINATFAHETGHLLGLRHPHDIFDAGCRFPPNNTVFEHIWSAMSYATLDKLLEFGTIDRANWVRNRAGYMVQAALAEGHDGTRAWDEAMRHLARREWREAGDVLSAVINADGSRPEYPVSYPGGDIDCSGEADI